MSIQTMNVLGAVTLLLLTSSPFHGRDTVCISLFSLFKPETLQVRIASAEGAILDAPGLAGNRSIVRGESIRMRLSGGRLNLVVVDSHGAIKKSALVDGARIEPGGSGTIELVLPGRIKRAVRGTVSVDAGVAGRGPLRVLLTTGRESAVASVVAAETNRREPEALKAIAVIVRTYMLSQLGRHASEGFDFCDTTHCQFYRGEQDFSDKASPALSDAVVRTSGQVLSFEGRPVDGYYTAACGGMSATPSMVWGGSRSYPFGRIVCHWCRRSQYNKWERSADASRILESLSAVTSSRLSLATELVVDSDQPSGFVQAITVRDGVKRVVLSADAFRRAVGLKLGWNTVLSPTFTVERRGSRFIFRGRGFGSQVGLCEEGAVAQAAAGRTFREILGFYYPGAAVGEPSHD